MRYRLIELIPWLLSQAPSRPRIDAPCFHSSACVLSAIATFAPFVLITTFGTRPAGASFSTYAPRATPLAEQCVVPIGQRPRRPRERQVVESARDGLEELRRPLVLRRALTFDADGQLARVRKQLYLSSAGLNQSDVLLRQRALATNYRYFTFFGIQYRFGSIANSVVNSRFGNINGTDDF